MKIKETLYKEIEDELQALNEVEVGTDEYKSSVDGVTKLLDRAIEIEKHEAEMKEREAERIAKNIQVAEEQKDRVVKNCISAGGVVLPLLVTIWGTLKSFKFEQDGTVTTIMGRGFINKLLPKK